MALGERDDVLGAHGEVGRPHHRDVDRQRPRRLQGAQGPRGDDQLEGGARADDLEEVVVDLRAPVEQARVVVVVDDDPQRLLAPGEGLLDGSLLRLVRRSVRTGAHRAVQAGPHERVPHRAPEAVGQPRLGVERDVDGLDVVRRPREPLDECRGLAVPAGAAQHRQRGT